MTKPLRFSAFLKFVWVGETGFSWGKVNFYRERRARCRLGARPASFLRRAAPIRDGRGAARRRYTAGLTPKPSPGGGTGSHSLSIPPVSFERGNDF